jgi:hypothetical protein
MSAAGANHLDLTAPPVTRAIQKRSLIVGIVFAILSGVGVVLEPTQFHVSYLLGYMLWLGLTLGLLAFQMLVHVTGGKWGQAVRRILEAGSGTLWLMIILFIPNILGMRRLYIWTRPEALVHDKQLQRIASLYLSPHAFLIRAAIYFVLWALLVFFLNRWSGAQDKFADRDYSPRMRALSAPGLVLYGFSISFAAVDWVMSLDPHWISTIYGLIFVAGEGLSAVCFVVVVVTILNRYRPMEQFMKADHIHDYGKLMITFIMLWAYFSFSQWLIIWAGNLPDEISWYMTRLSHGWAFVGLFLALFHFCVPFAALLSRSLKRKTSTLVWVAIWLMLMRYLDLFWHIEPTFHPSLHLSWLDIVVPVAIGGFWLAVFFRNLGARPILPLNEARTREVLEAAHG